MKRRDPDAPQRRLSHFGAESHGDAYWGSGEIFLRAGPSSRSLGALNSRRLLLVLVKRRDPYAPPHRRLSSSPLTSALNSTVTRIDEGHVISTHLGVELDGHAYRRLAPLADGDRELALAQQRVALQHHPLELGAQPQQHLER